MDEAVTVVELASTLLLLTRDDVDDVVVVDDWPDEVDSGIVDVLVAAGVLLAVTTSDGSEVVVTAPLALDDIVELADDDVVGVSVEVDTDDVEEELETVVA